MQAASYERRDLSIEVRSETGDPKLTFRIYQCVFSEYQGLPDMDKTATTVVLHMQLKHEGWRLASPPNAANKQTQWRWWPFTR